MFLPREEGQGWVEYALIIVVVVIVVIAAVTALIGPASDLFDRIKAALGGV